LDVSNNPVGYWIHHFSGYCSETEVPEQFLENEKTAVQRAEVSEQREVLHL
jgi:hypothetical protein